MGSITRCYIALVEHLTGDSADLGSNPILFISFPFTKLTCISIGLICHTKYCLILKMREAMFHEHFLHQFKMDFLLRTCIKSG